MKLTLWLDLLVLRCNFLSFLLQKWVKSWGAHDASAQQRFVIKKKSQNNELELLRARYLELYNFVILTKNSIHILTFPKYFQFARICTSCATPFRRTKSAGIKTFLWVHCARTTLICIHTINRWMFAICEPLYASIFQSFVCPPMSHSFIARCDNRDVGWVISHRLGLASGKKCFVFHSITFSITCAHNFNSFTVMLHCKLILNAYINISTHIEFVPLMILVLALMCVFLPYHFVLLSLSSFFFPIFNFFISTLMRLFLFR